MEYFQALGHRILELWKRFSDDYSAFSSVAVQALEVLPPPAISVSAVLDWAMHSPLPPQEDLEARFGQPPLTMFAAEGFRIELLFWTTGLPSIHQHGFSGAFYVLHGSSLHTVWTFFPRRRISHRLQLGDLTLQHAEVLTTGSLRQIGAGQCLIHATFHLDLPTVTLVIRTNSEPSALPQYIYNPPYVAYDPDTTPQDVRRRRQLLSLSFKAYGHDAVLAHLETLLLHSDPCSAYEYALHVYSLMRTDVARERVLALLDKVHANMAASFREVFAAMRWREQIQKLRARITDRDLQFFLALLLNLPTRSDIEELITKRYPGTDIQQLLIQWFADLHAASNGTCNPLWETIVTGLLCNRRDDQIVGSVQERFGSPVPREHSAALSETISAIRRLWFLRPFITANVC